VREPIGTQLIQIWHVTLQQVNVQYRGTSLSATLLSSFPREDCGLLRAISLLGRSIAFAITTVHEGIPHYISIVNWAEANIQNQSHCDIALKLSYPRKVISVGRELLVSRSIRLHYVINSYKLNRIGYDYSQGTRYALLQITIVSVFTTHLLWK